MVPLSSNWKSCNYDRSFRVQEKVGKFLNQSLIYHWETYSRYANLSISARRTLQLKSIGTLRSVLVNLQNLGQIEQWYRASWGGGQLSSNENIRCTYFFIEKTKERERQEKWFFLYFTRMCTDRREKRDRCAFSWKNKNVDLRIKQRGD